MDPWLEDPGIFPDLHNTFIAELRAQMTARLPNHYYTSIENRIFFEDSDWAKEPDINIDKSNRRSPLRSEVTNAVMEYKTKPIIIATKSDPRDEWRLEVRNTDGDELVTAVEILSPSNKRNKSRGREAYLAKQKEYLDNQTHLVEIDLLRAGLHSTSINLAMLSSRTKKPFDYHVCVYRRPPNGRYEIYPFALKEPLPTINIPLLSSEPDAQISLQDVMERSYIQAGYDRRLDYTQQPQPKLNDARLKWAMSMISQSEIGKS